MNIFEYFGAKPIAAYWNENARNVEYVGKAFFPDKKKLGLDLSFIRGHKGVAISLMPSAFDAKATFRDREGFNFTETEMPFFREGYHIGEKDRQELLKVMEGNNAYAMDIIGRVYDDVGDLIAGALVVPERMRMQLLFPEEGNVGINISANGVDYVYNYDPDGSWKTANYTVLTGTDAWDNASNVNPLAALLDVQDAAKLANGNELTIAMMNSVTFAPIANNALIIKAVSNDTGLASKREILDFIQRKYGITIVLNDNVYRDESKAVHKFAPDGYVAFLPAGTLGGTYFGTTPEEADLLASNAAEVEIVETGVAITRETQTHPVNVNIFASEITLPSFERMDDFYSLKVFAGE